MAPASHTTQSLFTRDGRRKYLTPAERAVYLRSADQFPCEMQATFFLLLAHAGCRISEALSLTLNSFDRAEGVVIIRSLKKRRDDVFRQVPLPPELIDRILRLATRRDRRIWTWSRGHAWRLVKALLAGCGVPAGPHSTPRGLRHAFGVHAVRSGIPLNMLQRWLGHASISTTAIYADLLGPEELELAKRMWT